MNITEAYIVSNRPIGTHWDKKNKKLCAYTERMQKKTNRLGFLLNELLIKFSMNEKDNTLST